MKYADLKQILVGWLYSARWTKVLVLSTVLGIVLIVKVLQTECHLFVLNFLGLLKEFHVPA